MTTWVGRRVSIVTCNKSIINNLSLIDTCHVTIFAGIHYYIQGGRAAVGSARVAWSGYTAPQSSQSTRGGGTAVGYNLHGIVTGREPIELK